MSENPWNFEKPPYLIILNVLNVEILYIYTVSTGYKTSDTVNTGYDILWYTYILIYQPQDFLTSTWGYLKAKDSGKELKKTAVKNNSTAVLILVITSAKNMSNLIA